MKLITNLCAGAFKAPRALHVAAVVLCLAACAAEAPPLLRGPPGGASPIPTAGGPPGMPQQPPGGGPPGGAAAFPGGGPGAGAPGGPGAGAPGRAGGPPPGGGAPGAGAGRQQFSAINSFPALQEPEKIADNLYVIVGKGGNAAVWIHSQGALLVDPKFGTLGPQLIAMIRKLTDKPITHVVCTHIHEDHCGSLGEFPNAQLILQESAAANAASMPQLKDLQSIRTYKDELKLFSGKDTVELRWFGRAHTGGDTVVIFPRAGVMHIGDIMKRKELPAPNSMNGGSGVQFADTLGRMLKEVHGVKWIIGGHNDQLLLWSDLRDYEQVAKLVLEHERAGVAQGQTAEQVMAGLKLPEKYSAYQPGSAALANATMAVRGTLQELKAGDNK